ncbi:MAG: GIY-YIG nuclease family protein [Bacteroidales bacterium]|nr:GIY-YIG nuclease family protein [Bacteroidales bacterium]
MYYCYILYSPSKDTFYVGSTRLSTEQRLERHLSTYYGSMKFTSKFNDWELFHAIACQTFPQAMAIEKHIKKMKSKKYIRNFKLYPELSEKLFKRYTTDS